MRPDQVALQLYTVRHQLADDPEHVLAEVAACGYRFVELAGIPGGDAVAFRRTLDRAGLAACGAHVEFGELVGDVERALDDMDALGCRFMVIPGAPTSSRGGSAAARRMLDELSPVVAAADARGVIVGYHNHDFEFEPYHDGVFWDALLGLAADVAPSLRIELDVYWAAVAGRDPVREIDAVAGRLYALHAKDVDRVTGSPAMPGTGVLDWPGIRDAARRVGVAWYIAEQDDPSDPVAAVRDGFAFLRSLSTPFPMSRKAQRTTPVGET
jgi:sugar phosphate isomerase/epimerase